MTTRHVYCSPSFSDSNSKGFRRVRESFKLHDCTNTPYVTIFSHTFQPQKCWSWSWKSNKKCSRLCLDLLTRTKKGVTGCQVQAPNYFLKQICQVLDPNCQVKSALYCFFLDVTGKLYLKLQIWQVQGESDLNILDVPQITRCTSTDHLPTDKTEQIETNQLQLRVTKTCITLITASVLKEKRHCCEHQIQYLFFLDRRHTVHCQESSPCELWQGIRLTKLKEIIIYSSCIMCSCFMPCHFV